MPGGHSEWVPPLPIPNRTVKPLSADDSTDTRAKVGHRQAPHQGPQHMLGAFALSCPSSRVYDRLHRVREQAEPLPILTGFSAASAGRFRSGASFPG